MKLHTINTIIRQSGMLYNVLLTTINDTGVSRFHTGHEATWLLWGKKCNKTQLCKVNNTDRVLPIPTYFPGFP